ncbi:acylneuraminate cytidylyltransferase family protein [Shewanella putrefaciens]|uniref:acylneuraminate cytidylyltransferase family protein n=1 Tax=unclassified Shewanella TaxID=196818 RepID=UPI0020045B9C|nr:MULTISPECIES: acylneuraminate cytidylyltransferase family protein [unclassified Shewanella]MCK7630240.1 acylneuraminate cytidylyltransferase family protein [Shewanella sp. JNE9-1]MCK7653400.1 acylneuraminate cytidylyltransferase family protein [Shewanella sp. JNE4-1]
MKILAITPARGGSKRLPGKNIKNLNGKPLIQWTIDAALAVQEIARVMVTTDCEAIAEIAKQAGAEVPFIRPPELATDTSSSTDVIRHALDFYRAQGEEFDFVLLLQPTSPIRSADDIRCAIAQLKAHTADAVVSVCPCEHSPLWANTLPDDRSMADFIRHEVSQLRSQDLPDYYRINGAIYLTRVRRFYQENSLFLSSNIFAYVMDNESSVDIDHELDFLIAETVLKYREQNA